MILMNAVRDFVPPEAVYCTVRGHTNLYCELGENDWLVAAVPAGRPAVHASNALMALTADDAIAVLEDENLYAKDIGLRDDVKLFRILTRPIPVAMSEEEALAVDLGGRQPASEVAEETAAEAAFIEHAHDADPEEDNGRDPDVEPPDEDVEPTGTDTV